MNEVIRAEDIKERASELGFTACGIAPAEPVDECHAASFRAWLDNGEQASMHYMENHLDKRLDPRLLLPGAQSVIAVALNYFPSKRLDAAQLQFAYYAYGRDYHDVMRERLTQLAAVLHGEESPDVHQSTAKICCDTVPMLDRYWAWRTGLGWIGKNTNLIIPRAGSFFFLGEIITTFAFDLYDTPQADHCGTCDRCMKACPTQALNRPYTLDSRRCLSFLTIENRGPIPAEQAEALGNSIYGCDRCQLACPHNRFAQPTQEAEFAPSDAFLSMQPDDWKALSVEDYRSLFRGSAVKRAKYEGLLRNIRLAGHPDSAERP